MKLKKQFKNTINICINARVSTSAKSDRRLTKTVTLIMNAICVSQMRLFSLNLLMIEFIEWVYTGMIKAKQS